MNRRILLQATAPPVVIGLLLFATCLLSAWYINRLQTNRLNILSQHVSSLSAARQLEIHLRQLRFHSFLFLTAPTPDLQATLRADEQAIEKALEDLRQSAFVPHEWDYIRAIEDGYQRYRAQALRTPADRRQHLQELAEEDPLHSVVEPCHELFRLNKDLMDQTSQDSDRLTRQLQAVLLFLGLGGPLSGLIMGYGIARGLSRSIYQLSVRVQDMAQCLAQDVASVSVTADADIHALDRQLQHVLCRVQEVAERLQQHQREMLRAQQLAAVGQLAASVAHEVRNPLTAIKMLVEVALRPRERKSLTADDLEVIHAEIARLEQTVQGFLDFARLPTPQRSPCDLREVLGQAVELVQLRAQQQGVVIDVDCPQRAVAANVDRGQLNTVLVNLFINALDAMPRGGHLQVDLAALPEKGIQLTVADTGSGIAPEMADRLFVPFASTKPTGTGLGLSISLRIIEEHGGRVTAANRPEGGACFTILLPSLRRVESHAHSVSH